MQWHKFILAPFLAPTDTPADTGGIDKEDVIKMFGEGDEEEETTEPLELAPKKDESKDKKDKDDEEEEPEVEDDEKELEEDDDEELKALEDELKEPTEEELELVTPVRRKEILAKYPKLFKDFPYLENAYYRERKFTEIYPTIQEAETAQRKGKALDSFETELKSGKTENILKIVKDADINAFNKIVDDYLPTLSRVDDKAFYHVIGGVIKDTIISMVREARSSKNEELTKAAEQLNKFIFGTTEFVPHEPLAKEQPKSEVDEKLRAREQQIVTQKFESTRDELNTKVDNILRKTIDGNIDPRESMTGYVKKNASREALESVTAMIDRDNRFKQLLDRLWERAIKNDFNKEDTDRIKNAYLSKAKTLLPTVIKKARTEALKGMGKRVREEKEEVQEEEEVNPPKKEKEGRTTPSPNRGQKTDKERAKEIPANMSTRDYLMQD